MSPHAKSAEQIMDVIPRVMDCIRCEMRSAASAELTVPQFRVLVKLAKRPTTHKEVAGWLGVTLPTLSRMIDALIQKRLVRQEVLPDDRRKFSLSLTPIGRERYEEFRSDMRRRIEAKISQLTAGERAGLVKGLNVLGGLFPSRR